MITSDSNDVIFNVYMDLITPVNWLNLMHVICRLDAIFTLHVLCEVAKINHEVLRVIQQIAKYDILMVGTEATEEQAQNKRISKSHEIAMQMVGDSLDAKSTGWNVEYKEADMKHPLSRCRMNKKQTGNVRPKDFATSSLGYLDRLNEFLDPQPMGVARCEIGHESSSSPVEDEDDYQKETNLFLGIESQAEEKDNFMQLLDNKDESGSRLSPIDSTEGSLFLVGEGSHVGNVNHIEAMNSEVESRTSDIASLSDGILADLSSLASDEPHVEYKVRSSKRRLKKKSASHSNVLSSDESVAAIKEQELKRSSDDEYKRNSSVASLNVSRQLNGA